MVEQLPFKQLVASPILAGPTEMAWVYILRLSNNKFYVGSTSNLNQRLYDHSRGKSSYTKKFLPIKLEFSQQFDTLSEAIKTEKHLKKLKSSIIIQKIINSQSLKISW